jgi:cytidyltransferase-like protein
MKLHERELPDLRRSIGSRPIVFEAGAFDGLHGGHVQYVKWGRELAGSDGVTVALVRTDRRIRQVKGPPNPLFPQDERLDVVDTLRPVDYAFLASDKVTGMKPSIHAALLLQPDIVAIGDGWKDELPLWRVALPNARIVIAPFPHIDSTTAVINRIRNFRE